MIISREKIISLVATVLCVVLMLIILVVCSITYPPAERDPWDMVKGEVLLADEYIPVQQVVIPPDTGHDQPARGEPAQGEDASPGQASSTDLEDAGDIGPTQPVLTAEEEAPVKVQEQKKPDKPGTPRKNDKARQEASARNINTSVNNAFTPRKENSAGTNLSAPAKPTGGNTLKPVSGVTPGARIGNGWSAASFGKVGAQNKPLGTVIIDVEVDAQGNVISASPAGGTPPAASNAAVVAECIRAAKESRFKRSLTTAPPERSRGQIFWTFTEQK